MTRFTSFFVLAAAFAALVFAQNITQTPRPMGGGPTASCGPIVHLYDGSTGTIFRTCESGGKVNTDVIGGGFGGYLRDMATTSDGDVMLLLDDGRVIRNRLGMTQFFPTTHAAAFLRSSFDKVVVTRERGDVWQYDLNLDASFFARPLWLEPSFPDSCSQIINTVRPNNLYGAMYCLDKDNGKISRAAGKFLRPARVEEAVTYFERDRITFAREYRGGLLVLVRPQVECGPAVPIPSTATLCYSSDACKETAPAQLLYVVGDKPEARVLPFKLSVEYATTFSVVGDTVLIVESEYDKDRVLIGDHVSKLDLVTGRKSVYISLDDFRQQFGIRYPELWIN